MLNSFYNNELLIDLYKSNYNLVVSDEFLNCGDLQLAEYFKLKTGLKAGKKIGCSFPGPPYFFYNHGTISQMGCIININNYGNPATIHWKSTSGRIYKPADTDINCDDIEFWFEGLDPLEYQKQLHPNNTLPFKLNNLSYDLVVSALNMDMTIEMHLQPGVAADANQLIEMIDKMMDDYNTKSMENDRKQGVVHNWKRRFENEKLIYDIDTGSAGLVFLKKLLLYLSKLNVFSKVEVL